MTREEIKAELLSTFNTWFDKKLNAVEEEWHLQKDLGMDSLDIIDLWLTLEGVHKLDIPEEEIKRCETVKDIVDLMERHVSASS